MKPEGLIESTLQHEATTNISEPEELVGQPVRRFDS